jgi:hypothetical protein
MKRFQKTRLSNVEGGGRGDKNGILQGMTGTTNLDHNNPNTETELLAPHK